MTEKKRDLIEEALERNRKEADAPNALRQPRINPITKKPIPKPKEKQ
jgi:hypothetical protein